MSCTSNTDGYSTPLNRAVIVQNLNIAVLTLTLDIVGITMKNKQRRALDEIAKIIMEHLPKADKKNVNRIFTDEKGDGCYNYDGHKVYCDHGWHKRGHCGYIHEVGQRCLKWQKSQEIILEKKSGCNYILPVGYCEEYCIFNDVCKNKG
jgi:hypothetical protein